MVSFSLLWPNGPLTRYLKLRFAHAPGMPGTFSPAPWVSDPGMHHGMCVMHVPWCMPGSLTSDFLWRRRCEKRSQHSRRMRKPQFYVSGKRPMTLDAITEPIVNPGLDNGLSHFRCQSITRTNSYLLSIAPYVCSNCQWNSRIKNMKKVVCHMSAILSRPQCAEWMCVLRNTHSLPRPNMIITSKPTPFFNVDNHIVWCFTGRPPQKAFLWRK